MGRSASHICLECALNTRPTVALISEEVDGLKWTLQQVVNYVTDIIEERSKNGKDYGIVLIPEGIVQFINEVGLVISEINDILSGD